MQRTVTTFCTNVTSDLLRAADGERVEVDRKGRTDYSTVISTDELRRLDHAATALRGFLRLAARGADCEDYQEQAETLVDLIDSGAIDLPAEIVADAQYRAARRDATKRLSAA